MGPAPATSGLGPLPPRPPNAAPAPAAGGACFGRQQGAHEQQAAAPPGRQSGRGGRAGAERGPGPLPPSLPRPRPRRPRRGRRRIG